MLVTLAEMKTYLGIATANTANDTFLTSQITMISAAIELYCRRVFASATYAQTFYVNDYPKTRYLEMFHYPIVSVTSVVEDGVTMDTADYRINKPAGVLTKVPGTSHFLWADITVVTYVAGYATIPEVIKHVVYGIVEERYNKKISGVNLNFGSDVQRVSIPGAISVDFDYSLNNNERKSALGSILGVHINVLDSFRSERSVMGSGKLIYIA